MLYMCICYSHHVICCSSIAHLEQGKQGPVVGVKGRSLMPYCHFELKDSDYLSAARRNPELRGPEGSPAGTTLDPNTRVIEMYTVGVGVKHTRRFSVINPTNQRYAFSLFALQLFSLVWKPLGLALTEKVKCHHLIRFCDWLRA